MYFVCLQSYGIRALAAMTYLPSDRRIVPVRKLKSPISELALVYGIKDIFANVSVSFRV